MDAKESKIDQENFPIINKFLIEFTVKVSYPFCLYDPHLLKSPFDA